MREDKNVHLCTFVGGIDPTSREATSGKEAAAMSELILRQQNKTKTARQGREIFTSVKILLTDSPCLALKYHKAKTGDLSCMKVCRGSNPEVY